MSDPHAHNRSTTQPLISGGFDRVSTKRPCRICGKPTYCGFSKDERTSICMNISAGSRRTSRNGGYVHVHTDLTAIPISPQPTPPARPTIPLAPLEIRNAVFSELIRISPASYYHNELISGRGGLLSRGLLARQISDYGALPPSTNERSELAAALRRFVHQNFTDYAKLYSRAGIVGIPGFWQEHGIVHIWKRRNYHMPLLVIPYRNAAGSIQACQIRLHHDDIPPDSKKYRWLASPLEPNGTSSGTSIHFTFRPQEYPAGQTILITEGRLKADVFIRFRPKARVIATTGVSCSHNHMIEAARPYNVLIGFDSDHRTNPNVCHQLARLIAQRTNDSREHRLSTSTKIVTWKGRKGIEDAPKGIDEAAQKNIPLTANTISEWYATLKDEPLEAVTRYWTEIGFKY